MDGSNSYSEEENNNEEYQDELDRIDVSDESPSHVIKENKESEEKEEDVSISKVYDTKRKIIPGKVLLKDDIKDGVNIHETNYLRYPRKLNPNKDIPNTNIYIPQTKEGPKLPEGMAIEQVYEKIKIVTSFHQADWDKVIRMIKLRRETIKAYFVTAVLRYTRELELIDKIKKEQIEHYAKEEVRLQVEAELEKHLMLKKALWEPRFGKKEDSTGPKTPADVIADIDKELGIAEGLDEFDQEQKDKLVDRLKKKSLWKPRYTKKPPAISSKVDKSPDEDLEEEVDRLNNKDNSKVEEDNFVESIKTEGVLPEEKGITQDTGADDAPTQEEMTA
jgi:hypothetical protein